MKPLFYQGEQYNWKETYRSFPVHSFCNKNGYEIRKWFGNTISGRYFTDGDEVTEYVIDTNEFIDNKTEELEIVIPNEKRELTPISN